MRKKVVIIILAIVCLLAAGMLFWQPIKAGTGIYVAADSPVILFHEGSGEPVVMLGRREGMFEGLQTGDRILILHDGTMMLSYPAQMNVFFCIRLKKGDVSSVPEGSLDLLEELGWL